MIGQPKLKCRSCGLVPSLTQYMHFEREALCMKCYKMLQLAEEGAWLYEVARELQEKRT